MKNKINISFYENAKADYIKHLLRVAPKKWTELNAEISLYCACTGLPVYAAIVFCEPHFEQFMAELEAKKEAVREFYNYE